MNDDLERVLGELEEYADDVWPPASKKAYKHFITLARAAAAYVAWIERPRTDKEIESPHAAKGRHLYNTLRSALGAFEDDAALRALTETNQPSGSE